MSHHRFGGAAWVWANITPYRSEECRLFPQLSIEQGEVQTRQTPHAHRAAVQAVRALEKNRCS